MSLQLLGEGNANRVYKLDGDIKGKVLRVSKTAVAPEDVLQWIASWPTLANYLPAMELYNHPELGNGILMDHIGANGSLLFEFKPKWLLQSPDASPHARRCRTCALAELRGNPRWCPLQLAAKRDLAQLLSAAGCKYPHAVAAYLENTDLIESLMAAQANAPSLFSTDPDEQQELRRVMSIRDCTVLLERADRAWESNSFYYENVGYIRARLVDVDPKPPRFEKWQSQEAQLQALYSEAASGCFL